MTKRFYTLKSNIIQNVIEKHHHDHVNKCEHMDADYRWTCFFYMVLETYPPRNNVWWVNKKGQTCQLNNNSGLKKKKRTTKSPTRLDPPNSTALTWFFGRSRWWSRRDIWAPGGVGSGWCRWWFHIFVSKICLFEVDIWDDYITSWLVWNYGCIFLVFHFFLEEI